MVDVEVLDALVDVLDVPQRKPREGGICEELDVPPPEGPEGRSDRQAPEGLEALRASASQSCQEARALRASSMAMTRYPEGPLRQRGSYESFNTW